MNTQNPRNPAPAPRRKKPRIGLILLAIALMAVFCFSAYRVAEEVIQAKKEKNAFDELAGLLAAESATPAPYVQPPAETRTPLEKYAPLIALNPDFFGWLSIEGTVINYPVMHTPDRPEYYLHRAFDGSYSNSGVPFVEEECPPDGNYFLIHGHHMKNKTMFGSLPLYAAFQYGKEHALIRFDTLYEQREYQLVAAFYSRACAEGEPGVFRYYAYADLTEEAVFEEYMAQVRAAALYDTGVDAAYGDELLVLSTCNYHTENGRFAVVAKRVK